MMSHSTFGFINKDQLEVGDVILIPVKCYVCSAIETNTNSRFSHLGIVVNKQKEVAHALGKVKKEPLKNFLKMKDPNREAAVVRPVGFNLRTRQKMTKEFYKNYLGLPYDSEFLWDNYNIYFQEKLYCSEFIAKLLNKFLKNKIEPIPMDYSENIPFWSKYFNGKIPQGLPGVTPSAFYDHPSFIRIY